jgi:hypothetical protein
VDPVVDEAAQTQAIVAAVVAAAVEDNSSDSEDSAAVRLQQPVAIAPTKKTKGSKRARYEKD